MDTRTQKQIIITLVFVVMLAGLASGATFLYTRFRQQAPAGTCFDGIQNQNETGIDCGGVCGPCGSPPYLLQKIQVHWAKAFPESGNAYDFAAEIENPNFTYGSEDVEYHFQLLDSSGKEIQSVPGKTLILPQESRSVIILAVPVNAPPAQVVFRVDSVLWQRITGFSQSGIHVENRSVQTTGNNPGVYARMSGVVSNDSPYDLRSIEVNMVAYDSSGAPIAANHTNIQTVLSREKRYVEVLWTHPFMGAIDHFTIFGYSDFFADQNFITQHSTPEKFQEYYQ